MKTYYNSHTGQTKNAPEGFSWTTLLFGFFPAMMRGDIKSAFLIGIFGMFTLGLSNLIFAFTYNGTYQKKLVMDGFEEGYRT